jgi:two-component system NtrC family sensor kinase
MTDRKGHLRLRLGAIFLALATAAAVAFAIVNFQQRLLFNVPDDGVSWLDGSSGIQAFAVASNSPAERAGIKAGDRLVAIDGLAVHRALDVTKRLWAVGLWAQVQYRLERDGKPYQARVVVAPAPKPVTIENYLRIVGLLYLFIGLFIFVRRWNAPRAVHFYLFCLVSFVLYEFRYTGKLNLFDWEVYWAQAVATLLAPALLVHFALVFPERSIVRRVSHRLTIAGTYVAPALLLLVQANAATGTLGFVPSLAARIALDQLELGYLTLYFLLAAGTFLNSYRRAPAGVLRQQLKWVTGGTMAAIAPFALFNVLPFLLGAIPQPWMNVSALSLALLPLCFAYAIIRYRLMDVDIIFKRGLAYTAASAGVVAVYVAIVSLTGVLFHTSPTSSPVGIAAIIVVASFLFQPLREWIQARLDRFFYRDRFNYRHTLIEFGRTLTNEVRLEPMLASVMDRLSQTLLVDRLALFTEDPPDSTRFHMERSMGLRAAGASAESLDLSFLSPARPEFARGYLFYESPRAARGESESVRHALEQLDLNYFIPCRMRDHTVAIVGIGKTVHGDFLSSEDVELLFTLAGYVAIALDNARLYSSLENKALQIERLKDFSENIVESLNVGVLAVDLSGRVESWNTQIEELLGVPRDEAVNRQLDEVLPASLVAELAARSELDHVSSLYKVPLRTRNDRTLVVNVSIAPLVGKEGQRIGRLILLDDITQRTHLEDQLLQAEKLTSLGLLAAGVAHEVNTPLAVISNYIQMLAKQLPAGDTRQSLIDKIVKQTFRASEIVNHLLNFSRTGASEFQPVSLNQVVDETLSLLTHPFRTGKVQVIRNLSPELPAVLGSGNRLQQVFLNLFLNARDAMPSGGILEVRSWAHNGTVEVEVTDTGAGIPRENLARIFDPFFTTKGSARGTGLGLSVSYGIIKEHAGKIEVHSTPGKGTSFRVEFPSAIRKAVHA